MWSNSQHALKTYFKSDPFLFLLFLGFCAHIPGALAKSTQGAAELKNLHFVKCTLEFKSILRAVIDDPAKLDIAGAEAESSLVTLETLSREIESQLDFIAKKEAEIASSGFSESDRQELLETLALQKKSLSELQRSVVVWKRVFSDYGNKTAKEWKSLYHNFADIAGSDKANSKLVERIQAYSAKLPWPKLPDPTKMESAMLEIAARVGDVVAQNELGRRYQDGEGFEKNPVEAVGWYRKAAEQGYAPAQFNLGLCYAKGDGVKKESAEAVKWYLMAAEHGYVSAQRRLGFLFNNGDGVEKNPRMAVKWFRQAAAQGDAKSQAQLGYYYSTGEGVDPDPSEAFVWHSKAASKGEAMAQFNLGNAYQYGRGVRKNLTLAVEWYNKAAAQGNPNAKVALQKLQSTRK
jgi:TPR repeat protein